MSNKKQNLFLLDFFEKWKLFLDILWEYVKI